ncbi:uncharacterized protein LOC127751644 [Frankliniella occidentalis]|uniref:Uncharacterized protein LOC127751644 n=1 Tax=Frankliniella occidentalis TaxID=133901 RepID=A0A9C6X9D7_FRAOC|nr:uncharacterized protein LOC127751644 [Frankliniella occidentalis]
MWPSETAAAANGPAATVASSPPRRRRQSFTMRGSIVGISDGLRGSSRGHYVLLQALDMLVSMFVMTPAVVSYWRGTWALMDYYVFPDQPNLSNLLSMLIGAVCHIIFTMVQHPLERHLHPDKHRLMYYVLSRIYTAIFSFACVNSFRGVWKALDQHTGLNPATVAALTSVSVVALACMRALRNISSM